jgi:hypothetical protein
MKTIGMWVTAVTITLLAMAQEAPRVAIHDGADTVSVTISGGSGLHSLRKKENLASRDTSDETRLTTKTNIATQKKGAAAFFHAQNAPANDVHIFTNTLAMLDEGRNTFRYDTFGDESFWGGALKLHQAIAGANNGGVGPGVSPKTALAVGLKVDVDALPESLKQSLARGEVNLDDPATTLALLELNSVVGVKGFFDGNKKLTSIGINCALCHSTVDNSFTAGIGHRVDGWPNRDLNVGAIVNLAPDVSALTKALEVDENTVRTVLQS